MKLTRYAILGAGGVLLLSLAALLPTIRSIAAFVGTLYLLLAAYATLHGAPPTRSVLAAATSQLLAGSLLAGGVMAGVATFPTIIAIGGSVPALLLSGFLCSLVLAPAPAAFALAASGRARDRGPFVLGAVAVAVTGPLLTVAIVRLLGAPVGDAERAVGVLALAGIAAGVPGYFAFRRRVPGRSDAYPSLDELPVSRAALVGVGWLLAVVSGWGPARVVSGAAFRRLTGVVPPESLLAVPFLTLLAVTGFVAVGLRNAPDRLERLFGLAVVGYVLGVVVYVVLRLAAVSFTSPRYLGFGATAFVTVLAVIVLLRRP